MSLTATGLVRRPIYTKGHPRIAANNHPVRHGTVVGVHNGTILNDDELMAAAWLDERREELLYLARGVGRPLWIGTTRRELFFASTERALEIAEQYTGLRLRKRELARARWSR